MFAAALGITQENVEVLETALLEAVHTQDAEIGVVDRYGARYSIAFEMATETGRAEVLSAWIIRTGEDFPRLVAAYVSEQGRKGNIWKIQFA